MKCLSLVPPVVLVGVLLNVGCPLSVEPGAFSCENDMGCAEGYLCEIGVCTPEQDVEILRDVDGGDVSVDGGDVSVDGGDVS
ncbi:MAG: hypothetical protein GY822_02155, partial [Deltaproteobacteria bacterium]|nr:hypothetical protein [Deltaproteobacteria bacterium]